MDLYSELVQRDREQRPLRVALIGAGKFGGMFLAQAGRTPGLHVAAIIDRDPQRAQSTVERVGFSSELKSTLRAAVAGHGTWIGDDATTVFSDDNIDVVIEATGHVAAGVDHAQRAIQSRKHVVMVTVEADVLVGPILARRAAEAGVVYSLAYGDQPALICELVEWARICGFEVVCAGKGTKYLPAYHQSTPDTVWRHYGFTEQQVAMGDFNAQMFNSFLDGTKSAIEMAALANATGLIPQTEGLQFPPASMDDLANVCRPGADGGVLTRSGTVEVVSSLYRDGSDVPRDLRWGVYVTVKADSEYVKQCFREYGVVTDDSGQYAALYRPTHFIGLELGVSVVRAGLTGRATGSAGAWLADVAATAKRDLAPGEKLDGEGGACVYGRLVSASRSANEKLLPIGLAQDVRLRRPVRAGQLLAVEDIEVPAGQAVWLLREELLQEGAPVPGRATGGGG